MTRLHRGLSLVEVMVGLAMGMIAMLVIMQVFAVFEGGKRTVTAGGDAHSNGAIALYMIERDVRMAGWGMSAPVYASCNTVYSYCDGNSSCGGQAGPLAGFSFATVRIIDGGENPDAIAAQFFANPNLDTFRFAGTTFLRSTMPKSSSELNVASVAGCHTGGMALLSQAGACTLMRITQVQGPALKIQHNPGAQGDYNPPVNYQDDNGWPAYMEGATMACFEAAPDYPLFRRAYAVDTATRQLQRSDNTVTPPVADELIAPEVMDLQAQYGVAAEGSQAVGDDDWVDATGDWANPTQEDINRIKAVRIALLVRSTQYEKPVDGSCTTTTVEMAANWSSWATFDTSHYPSDWQCYRYKVFETVVPLRNVIWGKL